MTEPKGGSRLKFFGKSLGILAGVAIIGFQLAGHAFSIHLMILGILLILGFSTGDLFLSLSGEAAFAKSPRQMRREAQQRHDALVGKSPPPEEPEVPPEDFLKALGEQHRKN